jgi:tetratricopeptide (TPR) repeat protein
MRTLAGLIGLFALVLVFSPGCRKQYDATEVDKTNYGWDLYEQGIYQEANDWFAAAVLQDSAYKDGYNGLGWSFGKLLEMDSSVYYFQQGLLYLPDPNITVNLDHEIKAGLCFAYNAKGDDSLAIVWCENLLADLEQLAVPTWSFSHDTTLNHLDVRLTLATSYFISGDFPQSLAQVQSIVSALTPGATFTPDITTIAGRRELADEIEFLRTLLATP